LFWCMAIVPMFFVFLIGGFYGPYWFTTALLGYCLLYRPLLHIFRLLNLGAIEEKDAWKFFIPFYDAKYLRKLWLGY
ncbi:MAG TPA: hypothetical protein VEB86_06365, partial [Chryseosolibacter sp.]|nr:hypothetical protein [Chryseosolibacter sp.]